MYPSNTIHNQTCYIKLFSLYLIFTTDPWSNNVRLLSFQLSDFLLLAIAWKGLRCICRYGSNHNNIGIVGYTSHIFLLPLIPTLHFWHAIPNITISSYPFFYVPVFRAIKLLDIIISYFTVRLTKYYFYKFDKAELNWYITIICSQIQCKDSSIHLEVKVSQINIKSLY